MKTKLAKCPRCLPDAKGAYFEAQGDRWECRNCGHHLPRRINKPTPKITPSQQSVIDRIKAMGWEIEVKPYSGYCWVTGKRELGSAARNILFGDGFYGKIGKRGAFELTAFRLGGDKKITDDIELSVYLARVKTAEEASKP